MSPNKEARNKKASQFYIILNEKPTRKTREIATPRKKKQKGFKNCAC